MIEAGIGVCPPSAADVSAAKLHSTTEQRYVRLTLHNICQDVGRKKRLRRQHQQQQHAHDTNAYT